MAALASEQSARDRSMSAISANLEGTHPLRMAVLLLTLSFLNPGKNRSPISGPVLNRLSAALVTRVAKGVCSANRRVVAPHTNVDTLGLEGPDPILLCPAQFGGQMLEARAGPGLLGQDSAVFETANIAARPDERWYSNHWVAAKVVAFGNGSSTGRIVRCGTARVGI
ncbi:hypothetical protein NCU08575 [Neurospora crassa OR74A]|uniref:Uncharacterized protein n=1 Tax=Neurospora crassa (strain ATCC 24698 / 74-OR23-1A / CBS 708.71 / DSM 1257 / FGSC 987) TaxID=367110 RepID=Q7SB20_NEUCR|nr:hypothetical protein NCU08575 [Neurospora crassa OR74A]EAA33601.1 hypothetical protein NCU08575 [Neurospora crassa OR74A]|eukprot:XP_962837.1 hypothetical protein NCU08575 [Neurospora crassa OR74A]